MDDIKEIVDEYPIDDILDCIDMNDLLNYVTRHFEQDIIERIDERDLIRYGLPKHLVFKDQYEVIEYVRDNCLMESTGLEENLKLQSFRKSDVIDLINDITIRHGWDVVYSILERAKNRLNIP